MKSVKIILSISALLIISSCLTLKTNMEINNDGSGLASFSYSVSTLASDLGEIDFENLAIPFPIMRADYDIAAQKTDGIQIIRYNLTDDGSRYSIESEIAFDSLESFSVFSGTLFSLESSGNNKILTVTVYDGSGDEEVSGKALSMVRDSFPEDYFSFSIEIPGDIIQVEGATFTGSSVSFSISVEDLLSKTDVVQFSVEYR